MNEENFAAFFVLLAFIELSFTVTSLTGETNGNRRGNKGTRIAKKRKYFMKCFVDPRSNGFIGPCFNYKISNESEFLKL